MLENLYNMAGKRLVIFTEAGEGIGYGHLMRCRAIADSFRDFNWEVTIHLHLKNVPPPNDFDVLVYNWYEAPQLELKGSFQIAIIDSYLAPSESYKKVSSMVNYTCAIDDYNRFCYPASLVLNPGITSGLINYSNQIAPVVYGKEYVLLRKEILLANKSNQVFNTEIKIITITVGGSDIHNILPLLGKIVFEEMPEVKLRIILPDVKEAKELKTNLPNAEILGRQSANEIIKLFQSSDLVISACGQTLHELAFLGTPFLGILTGEDQRFNQAYYLKAGILQEEIKYSDATIIDKIRNQLQILRNPEKRKFQMQKLPELINENGALNVCNKLITNLNNLMLFK